MQIKIEIRLFATFKKLMPQSADSYQIEQGTSLSDLLALLRIPEDEARLLFVNSRKVNKDTLLNHGDRVGIFPLVGGG